MSRYITELRIPVDHANHHEAGGTDELKLDALGVPDDVTTLNSSTLRHGLLPKLSGSASDVLRGDGTWGAGGGGGSGLDQSQVMARMAFGGF